jgi:hypothetical protein
MKSAAKLGALTSLIVGLPIGLLTATSAILSPPLLSDEGIFTVAFFQTNQYSTTALLIVFIVMLLVSGWVMGRDIESQKSFLRTSLKYSAGINFTIWTTFIITHLLTNDQIDLLTGVLLPVGLALLSFVFTPWTVGLFIYWITKNRIEKMKEQIGTVS